MTPLQQLLVTLVGPNREGGVKDVGDGKGITRWGQTPGWLAQYVLPVPRSADEAIGNYEAWIAVVGLGDVLASGDNLADILLDIAVMSSAPKAIKALQVALGIQVDGVYGGQTKAALEAAASREVIAHLVIAWDMEYQGSIITLNPQRAEYAKGWAARMAGHVRRLV